MAAALGLAGAVALTACGDDASPPPAGADADAFADGADASVEPEIPNTPPGVVVDAPSEGAWVEAGEEVLLKALVDDAETPPALLTLRWSSSVDGLLTGATAGGGGLSVAGAVLTTPGLHVLTIEVTDPQGAASTASVSVNVNGPPTAPVLAITPTDPTTEDGLEAVIATAPTDPNRASSVLDYTYRWSRDGQVVGIGGPTVGSSQTAKGEVWTVEVRASDGTADGPWGSAEVTIRNSAPACTKVSLLPSAGTVLDPFTCTCAQRVDADGDPPDGDLCVFEVDGEPVASGQVCELPAGVATKGTSVTCKLTPHDGTEPGLEAVSSASPVLNAPPGAPTLAVSPSAGGLSTTFTCSQTAAGTDPDGDSLAYVTTWIVNGFENPGPAPSTVLASDLVRDAEGSPPVTGDPLACRARASDGASQSPPAESPAVVLGNSPPAGGNVLVAPADATELTVLSCEATGATDPDGDPVVWAYAWTVDGAPVDGADGATLTGEHFDEGQLVRCTATPSDGAASGMPQLSKNSVLIGNALPSVDSVTVTPDSADQTGAFTCTWEGWSDPDAGDAADVTLSWHTVDAVGALEPVEGADAVSGGVDTVATLDALGLPKGSEVVCVATPFNGAVAGPATESDPVVVVNTLPSVTAVTIDPPAGGPCDVYACVPAGVVDLDEADSALVASRWEVDGVALATAGELDGAVAGLEPGDPIVCFARATDGALGPGAVPLYGEETPSVALLVGNSAPVVGDVVVGPPNASPADVLSCTASGVVDPDGCQGAPSIAYQWYVGGLPVEGAVGPTFDATGLAPGTTVACGAVADDGYDTGDAVLSAPVDLAPIEPVVELSAPNGAAGNITCVLVTAAAYQEPLSYAWYWQVGEAAPQLVGQQLPAGFATDCDRLSCWAVASAGDYSVQSNVAVANLPFGAACDDLEGCTQDACWPEGGCAHTPLAGPCEDGDPCTVAELCLEGACTGGVVASCDDLNACTTDSCESVSGGCTHEPVPDGGPCGPLGVGQCIDGLCCVPSCEGKGCGSDGCGGSCGTCPDSEQCHPTDGVCIPPDVGMTFVPEGGFWMGCNENDDNDCDPDEYPFHGVTVETYQIDLTEVTVEAYLECSAQITSGCKPPGTGPGCNAAVGDGDDRPINCVTWFDSAAYCAWIGKRLCTEAEWENAARGVDARRYPWGFPTPDCTLAVVPDGADGCGTGESFPVGSKPDGDSPKGCSDMAGNVWEWVSDWYAADYYEVSPLANPLGPETGVFKTRRGGGYKSNDDDLRTSNRAASQPLFSDPEFGFRCCKGFPE